MADKHVIAWLDRGPSNHPMWYVRTEYGDRNDTYGSAPTKKVIRTLKFSDAYIFDSFEEAHEVYSDEMVQGLGSAPYIRYYTEQEYFKEVLARG